MPLQPFMPKFVHPILVLTKKPIPFSGGCLSPLPFSAIPFGPITVRVLCALTLPLLTYMTILGTSAPHGVWFRNLKSRPAVLYLCRALAPTLRLEHGAEQASWLSLGCDGMMVIARHLLAAHRYALSCGRGPP